MQGCFAYVIKNFFPFLFSRFLLFVFTPRKSPVGLLDPLFQELVHGEGDGLTRGHSHHTGSNSLVESPGTLLFEHVPCDGRDPRHGALAGLSRGSLQPRLDRVDGRVREWTHSTRDKADDGGLVRRKLLVFVLGLYSLEECLQLRVCGEVRGLVCSLPQRCQGDTTVECTYALLPDNGEQSVGGTSVFGAVERIRKTVMLGL